MKKYILFWGFIDVLTIFWFGVKDIFNHKIPIYDQLLESWRSSREFGFGIESYFFTVIPLVVYLSLLLSGILMIKMKKLGVYISFSHIPFRLIFIIPPTFFILSEIKSYVLMPLWVFLLLLYSVEVFKLITQIKWLRSL